MGSSSPTPREADIVDWDEGPRQRLARRRATLSFKVGLYERPARSVHHSKSFSVVCTVDRTSQPSYGAGSRSTREGNPARRLERRVCFLFMYGLVESFSSTFRVHHGLCG